MSSSSLCRPGWPVAAGPATVIRWHSTCDAWPALHMAAQPDLPLAAQRGLRPWPARMAVPGSVPTRLAACLPQHAAGVLQGAGGGRHGCLLGPQAGPPAAGALLLDACAPPAQVRHRPAGRPLLAPQGQPAAAEPDTHHRMTKLLPIFSLPTNYCCILVPWTLALTPGYTPPACAASLSDSNMTSAPRIHPRLAAPIPRTDHSLLRRTGHFVRKTLSPFMLVRPGQQRAAASRPATHPRRGLHPVASAAHACLCLLNLYTGCTPNICNLLHKCEWIEGLWGCSCTNSTCCWVGHKPCCRPGGPNILLLPYSQQLQAREEKIWRTVQCCGLKCRDVGSKCVSTCELNAARHAPASWSKRRCCCTSLQVHLPV